MELLNYLSWSNLTAVGKNPVSRLVAVSPVLAQILVHTPKLEWLDSLSLEKLHWAYWSLILFAIGQILYVALCPKEIKDYPQEHEFLSTLNNTYTDDQLKVEFHSIYKKHFEEYGGKLHLSLESEENVVKQIDVDQMRIDRHQIPSRDYDLSELKRQIRNLRLSIEEDEPYFIDWQLMRKGLSDYTNVLFKPGVKYKADDFGGLKNDIYYWQTHSQWRIHVLAEMYQRKNDSKRSLRMLIATLYLLGMSYFIYSGVWNVVRVLTSYWQVSS